MKENNIKIKDGNGHSQRTMRTRYEDMDVRKNVLGMIDIMKKGSGHQQDWRQIHPQPKICFEKRLS